MVIQNIKIDVTFCWLINYKLLFYFILLVWLIDLLFWVEANSRANYPVKAALNEMCNSGILQVGNEAVKYCISLYAMNVINVGLKYDIAAWNCHPIPGTFQPFSNSYIKKSRSK